MKTALAIALMLSVSFADSEAPSQIPERSQAGRPATDSAVAPKQPVGQAKGELVSSPEFTPDRGPARFLGADSRIVEVIIP